METNEKLKPCPFCGGEACKMIEEVPYSTPQYSVQCQNCKFETLMFDDKVEAVAAWNNRADSNYSVFPNSSKELMDFVKFCQNASEGCIVYINNRARDLIAKSKKCCEKSCKEENAKLTYADVEKMVKPLEWKGDGDYERAYISPHIYFAACGAWGVHSLVKIDKYGNTNAITLVEDGEKSLEAQKKAARKWLVDLVADALGVERSGE